MRPLGSPLRRRGYTGTAPVPKRRKRREYGIAYSQPVDGDEYADYQVKVVRSREAAETELAETGQWSAMKGAHLVVREVSPWHRSKS